MTKHGGQFALASPALYSEGKSLPHPVIYADASDVILAPNYP